MKTERAVSPMDLALIAVFAALVTALSLAPAIPLAGGVPLTLQTLGIALAGLILGPWRGCAAVTLYLIVGFAGLPVFAGGGATLSVLGKPAAGYLLSFPIAALVMGLVSRWLIATWPKVSMFVWLLAATIITRIAIITTGGVIGLMINAKMGLGASLLTDLAFWPLDMVKNVAAALIAVAVFKAFPRLHPSNAMHPATEGTQAEAAR